MDMNMEAMPQPTPLTNQTISGGGPGRSFGGGTMREMSSGGLTAGLPRPLAHHPHMMASGLASLGRNGDTTLVHMSPKEIGGLQSLAKATGGSLTINPHTGLYEAGWLSQVLPLIGGLVTGIFAPELLPYEAAATGLVKKATGGTWGEAFLAGLSAYGGGMGAESLAGMGATPTVAGAGITPASTTFDSLVPNLATAPASTTFDSLVPNLATAPASTTFDSLVTAGSTTPPLLTAAPLTNAVTAAEGAAPTVAAAPVTQSALEKVGSGLGKFAEHPIDASKQFYQGLGSSTLGRAGAMAGIATPIISAMDNTNPVTGAPINSPTYYIQAPGGKPLSQPGTVNPNIAKLGYIPAGQSAFTGQQFNPGVYSQSPTQYIPVIATPGSPVLTGREGGLMSIKRMASGGSSTTDSNTLSSMHDTFANQLAASQQPPVPVDNTALDQYLTGLQAMVTPPSMGMPASKYQTFSDMPAVPFTNTTSSTQSTPTKTPSLTDPNMNTNPSSLYIAQLGLGSSGSGFDFSPGSIPNGGRLFGADQGSSGYTWDPVTGKFVPSANPPATAPTGGYAMGGDIHEGLGSFAGTYAAGGRFLRGGGDGMSDSIPAVIHGAEPQRAALADGEFVVPADVVSHLGNGSSEAGSRALYKMMDKVRMARTGKKRQAPQVKTDRYLPA